MTPQTFPEIEFDKIPNPPSTLGERLIVDINTQARRQFDVNDGNKPVRYELHLLRTKVCELSHELQKNLRPQEAAETLPISHAELLQMLTEKLSTGEIGVLNKSACMALSVIIRTAAAPEIVKGAQMMLIRLMGEKNLQILNEFAATSGTPKTPVTVMKEQSVTLAEMGLVIQLIARKPGGDFGTAWGLSVMGHALWQLYSS